MTGYWKFTVPNGGLSYMELKQDGENVTSAGRRPMTGTLHDGKLHLQAGTGSNATVYEGIATVDKFSATRTTHDESQGGVDSGFFERAPAKRR